MASIDKPTKNILSDPLKRRAWCIYQLSIQGSSLAAVARGVGVDRRTVYLAFERPYPRMEKAVAEALDMQPQELFPERYDADGLPNRPMGRPPHKSTDKSICKRGTCNGNSRQVA